MRSKNLRRKNGQFSANWEKKVPLAMLFGFLMVGFYFYRQGTPEKPLFSQPEMITVMSKPSGWVGVAKAADNLEAPAPSVEDLIIQTFGDKWKIAYAVARAESGLREDAIGDHTLDYRGKDGKVYGMSLGVFQIRYLPGRPKVKDLLDAKFNIEYAYKMSKGGTDWSPWSAYKNQTYKQFMK